MSDTLQQPEIQRAEMPQPTEQKPLSRRQKIRRFGLLLVGLALFAIVLYLGGRDSLTQVARPQPLPLILGLIAIGGAFWASAGRWALITNRLVGRDVLSHFESFTYFVSGFLVGSVASQSVGTVAVRSAALNQIKQVPLGQSVASVGIDKLMDVLFIVLFGLPASIYFARWITLSQALGLAAVIFILFVALCMALNQRLLSPILYAVEWIFGLANRVSFLKKRLANLTANVDGLGDYLQPLMTPQTLLWIALYSLLKQIMLATRLYFIAQTVDLPISLGILFLGVPMAQFSLFLAFTPGALGVLEAGWYGILSAAAIDSETTITFVIAQRAYNFLYTVTLTILSYAVMLVGRLTHRFQQGNSDPIQHL